ncbi:4397_t:CDS:1, partial [Gigaspora rosea]
KGRQTQCQISDTIEMQHEMILIHGTNTMRTSNATRQNTNELQHDIAMRHGTVLESDVEPQ